MKQHTTPIVVEKTGIKRLEKINLGTESYTEEWLQAEIHRNPTVLPIGEIEPAFSNQVSICRELPTKSGACDNLLINDSGYVTIVECKLWKNPEARRKVVSQIIDYAKDIANWTYDQLEQSALSARGDNTSSLFELIQKRHPDIEQDEFIDRVQKNITAAKFLLLIAGDGVRENTEDLTSFLQKFGNLSFSLALVEMPLYRIDSETVLMTPRVLLRTTEIIRSIVRIEDKRIVETESAPEDKTALTNTESIFYERLEKSNGKVIANELKTFINSLEDDFGLITKMGRGKQISLNIKSAEDRYNFASIQESGKVWFYGIVVKTGEIGNRKIGIRYLKKLAEIVGGSFDDSAQEWSWTVRKNGKFIPVKEYLAHKTQWASLIKETMDEINQQEESN